jgi:hypothetical protein
MIEHFSNKRLKSTSPKGILSCTSVSCQSSVQVLLAWALQRGVIALPESSVLAQRTDLQGGSIGTVHRFSNDCVDNP